MKTQYPHMFSPITIGGVTFKNRIWSAPAGAHLLYGKEGYPNDHVVAYYANKARGGSANITVSAQNMDIYQEYDNVHAHENIFDSENHRFWNHLTDAIHFYGAKASMELLGGLRDTKLLGSPGKAAQIGDDGEFVQVFDFHRRNLPQRHFII